MQVKLVPHPSTPCPAIDLFEVQLERQAKALNVRYRVCGATDDILVPEIRSPAREDGLWQHTCFELFARMAVSARYREINLSPSTCWAAYEFNEYRSGMKDAPGVTALPIRVERAPGQLALEAQLPAEALTGTGATNVHIGLAAVLEHCDHRKSYWALAHPADKPDFHHPAAFTLAFRLGVSR